MKSETKILKKTQKRKTGDLGEEVACKYLEKKGYRVLERNYWKPWGEIDIVAEKANLLSFVEVKTVSRETSKDVTPVLGTQQDRREPEGDVTRESIRPEENFHPAKLKRLHRAVQTYLLDHKVPESKEWQIDLACVYLDFSTHKAKVELFENIIM